ncbi:MAG TPA: DegT/DnrJ/EryC1/StrS family aminotransferase, partial [Clostridia bacterium]|nr:DegT/DnrJ/EryC1/StrS family aminotransferase [Clostridia bacterium]
EVITSPYTFFASAECISVRGALPVFADIDPVSYCIDPQSVAKLINSRTRAIIPVHIFGQPADMDALMSLAREHRLAVVEDCAQAIGAEYAGKRVGGFGDMGTFSFFPTKNLGGCGDGGMVVTNNPEYAEALKIKRVHGSKPKYYHKVLGYNSRLDELQAALLNVKLPYLDAWNKRRREIAMNYNEAFASLPVHRPMEKPGRKHIYHLYMLQVPDRDDFRRFLKEKGVETGLYYPVPLHLQEVYRDLGYKAGDLPVSEHASAHCVALPCYPELTDDEQNEVISAVKAYFSS